MLTTDKSLQDRAIDIKGKEYVLVKDRILYFNEMYPNGSIITERISEGDLEIIKAVVTPDCDKPSRFFTGHSQAKWWDGFINKTACLENAESSAVGRALAMMGIGVIDSIASVDEINKAENTAKALNKLPEFTEKNLNELKMDKVQNFKTAEDLIRKICERFTVSEEMKAKIREIHASISQFINK